MLILIFLALLLAFSPAAIRSFRGKRYCKGALYATSPFIITVAIQSISHIYLSSLWYASLGYEARFWQVLCLKAKLFIAGGSITAIALTLNLALWHRYAKPNLPHLPENYKGMLYTFSLPVIALLSLVAGFISTAHWKETLLYLNATDFGKADPLFSMDMGVYIFTLPMLKFAILILSIVFMTSAAVTGLLYYLEWHLYNNTSYGRYSRHYNKRTEWDDEGNIKAVQQSISHRLFTQLSANCVLGAILLIAEAFVGKLSLLYSHEGVVYGAGWTDIHVTLPAYNIAIILLILAVPLLIYATVTKSTRRTIIVYAGTTTTLAILGILGFLIVPSIAQHYRVSPNELPLERPYLQRNIAFTREAYGLSNITEVAYPINTSPDGQLSPGDMAIINGIRLWAPDILKAVNDQTQFIRLYYNFPDIDVDRYTIDGKVTQLMLSVRELNVARLAKQSQTWQNQTMIYTHGYGDVAAPVNRFSREGLPEYLIKDIPAVSQHPELRIDQPRIYFGEETKNHVYVRTKLPEFDYPKGDTNAQNSYDGKDGVRIDSFLKKLAIALEFDGIRLFTTQELTPDSRILFNRDIATRVKSIAPFLHYDNDIYHAIVGGKIYYICDAYTTARTYPYSQPSYNGAFNYIRNSVKVVVDAYNGTVDFYVADGSDPIIRSYAKALPGLFKDIDKMPAALRAHMRYPEDLLRIQGSIYATYHMTDPSVFYNREDAWEISRVAVHTEESRPIDPYYLISKLKDNDREEFVLTIPFSPYSTDRNTPRNNMVSMIVGRCDSPNYGKIMVFKFPKDRQIYGPLQIGIRINQNETISKDLTLWNQQGSQIRFGNLLTVPLTENRLMYIQPMYIQASVGKMPELRRVVVVFGDDLAYGSSFEEALGKFFPKFSGIPTRRSDIEPTAPKTALPDKENPLSAANKAFNAYREATSKGRHEEAGRALDELGRILKQLK